MTVRIHVHTEFSLGSSKLKNHVFFYQVILVNIICCLSYVSLYCICFCLFFQSALSWQPEHAETAAVCCSLHVWECGEPPLAHRPELTKCLLWSLAPGQSVILGRYDRGDVGLTILRIQYKWKREYCCYNYHCAAACI